MSSPIFNGHVASIEDAHLLFDAFLLSDMKEPSCPKEIERAKLIKSGNVFVFERSDSSRWKDGIRWSPSRKLDGFLVYRELERPLPREARERGRQRLSRIIKSTEPSSKNSERSLVPSLSSYCPLKENGLVKKAVSSTVEGHSLCLVSYYTIADVQAQKFLSPIDHREMTIQAMRNSPTQTNKHIMAPTASLAQICSQQRRRPGFNNNFAAWFFELATREIAECDLELGTLQDEDCRDESQVETADSVWIC